MRQATEVRGWCPGALRPMASGDGLIVRARPRVGAYPVAALAKLADAARRCGNGVLDLTRRGNLQIRGVSAKTLDGITATLADGGLLDATAEAEAVRNVLVNPLAGIDPAEALDLRPVARALEAALVADPMLQALPGKFGFLVDGGGLLSLAGEQADIRLAAAAGDAVEIGVERPGGYVVVAREPADRAAAAAAAIARALVPALHGNHRRARLLSDAEISRLTGVAREAVHVPVSGRPGPLPLGPLQCQGATFAVGLAAAFGRTDACALAALCDLLAAAGVGEVRVSPWRAIYAPIRDADAAERLVSVACAAGFVTDAGDPLLAVDACPGAPACTSSSVDTRAVARALAPQLAALGLGSLHVSGCAKGCARSAPADLVLVGEDGRFGVVRQGTAATPPAGVVAARDVTRDLAGVLARGAAAHA
ncbi:MAG: precorrin-3B synthase [Hyphomicrobiaceae bacterium]